MVESEQNKERMYLVNMNCGFCQCPLGRSCGHKWFAGLSVVPKNYPRMRAFWHYIAIGSIQPEWLHRDENDLKELNLTGLRQKRKEPTRPEHSLSKAVSNG